MYSIALIQNESEMLRYSWADIRPMISREEYDIDSYTAENIARFSSELKETKYDAIIIAANACNDERVYNALVDCRDDLTTFLNRGGGLLVSFQMRLADKESYGFLPEEYDVKAINRLKELSESPTDGNLIVSEVANGHAIVEFPNKLDAEQIKEHCISNNTVQGYYWTFLNPTHQENYIPVIIDDTYDDLRNVLLVSNEIKSPRIVLSSISLDWQSHTQLWENTLRYVVKGRPTTAVVAKRGQKNFDFRYLVSILESEKTPYHLYSLNSIDEFEVPEVHDIVILDPNWGKNAVRVFLNHQNKRISEGNLDVLLLGKKTEDWPDISMVSNYRDQQSLGNLVLLWLQSVRDVGASAYWQKSFWCTFEVLSAFHHFSRPIAQFREEIVNEISKHNIDGSYDEVMGASCVMLRLYVLLLGVDNKATRKTIDWISQNIANKDLYEKAAALDTLVQLNIRIDETIKKQVIGEIIDRIKKKTHNEFELLRYCRTLLSCGEIEHALTVAKMLSKKQDKVTGKWINLGNTASTIDCLLDLYSLVEGDEAFAIEETIFLGIQYIKSFFALGENVWKQDASTSAKGIVVLDKFEKMVSLPVDLALQTMHITGKTNSVNSVLGTVSDNNVSLLKKNRALSNRIDELNTSLVKVKAKMNKRGIWASVTTAVALAMVVLVGAIVVYLQKNGYGNKIGDIINGVWEDYCIVILVTIIAVLAIGFIYILIFCGIFSYKSLPRPLKLAFKKLFGVEEKDFMEAGEDG